VRQPSRLYVKCWINFQKAGFLVGYLHTPQTKGATVLFLINCLDRFKLYFILTGDTMLQAGRSPVRVPDEVDFLIYLILPAR
jgi:hypothetical protein